ncbi:MAG TPA: SRPBCC domain-containing protein, partial [bacterium]
MGTASQSMLHHSEFTLERVYKATPKRLFAAWANVETKARWFRGSDDWKLIERSLDFRVGGKEVLHGRLPSGVETLYLVTYHAIHPNTRFVYSYDMHHSA